MKMRIEFLRTTGLPNPREEGLGGILVRSGCEARFVRLLVEVLSREKPWSKPGCFRKQRFKV